MTLWQTTTELHEKDMVKRNQRKQLANCVPAAQQVTGQMIHKARVVVLDANYSVRSFLIKILPRLQNTN